MNANSLEAFACGILSVLLLALPASSPAAPPRPPTSESRVSRQPDLIDAEYSQSRAMITWCDNTGNLWTAGVDRDTGLFVPSNGKGVLVDPDAMRTGDLMLVGNGPEWISTAGGDQIVYTKYVPGGPHILRNARLALAQQAPDGGWSHDLLSPLRPRDAPYASHNADDPAPAISYVDPYDNHYWRNLDDASSEMPVPQYPASPRSLRFVEGARAAVFTAPVDGISQIFLYWLDSQSTEQLTFDDGQKDLHSVPWAWRAPEFGGDLVVSTVVDDTELRMYRQPGGQGDDPGDDGWTLVDSMRTPQGGVMNSPEPFVHNGESYVFFSVGIPPDTDPTAVFLANIDASQPVLVQLTPNLPRRIRRDPEVFVANDGPYIYYNRLTIDGNPFCMPCNEGVYRTYTGLPPAR